MSPTDRQRKLLRTLAGNPALLDLLTPDQKVVVRRGIMPGAADSHMYQALEVLRRVRDKASMRGEDPTPTPEDTFEPRLAAWLAAWETFQGKHAKAASLAAVAHSLSDPANCVDCGHQHEDADACYQTIKNPVNQSAQIQCPCPEFVPPEMESVIAWYAARATYDAARAAESAWIVARRFEPGDILTVTGGTRIEHGTEGAFIRQEQLPEGVAYEIRTTEGDVWVAHYNASRAGDELIPATMPDEITRYTRNNDLAP